MNAAQCASNEEPKTKTSHLHFSYFRENREKLSLKIGSREFLDIWLDLHVLGGQPFLKFSTKFSAGKRGQPAPKEWRCDVLVFKT